MLEVITNNVVSIATGVVVIVVLGWGYVRSRTYGKLGILSWWQSLTISAPWLIFFVLLALEIYPSGALILSLIVGSIVLYFLLGRRIRTLSQEIQKELDQQAKFKESVQQTIEQVLGENSSEVSQETSNLSKPDAPTQGTSKNLENRPNLLEPNLRTPLTWTGDRLPLGFEFQPMSAEDLEAVRSIFGVDTFFATETIPYQAGAVFRGNLRGEPAATYETLAAKLAVATNYRYRLFLINNRDGKPVVVVLPTANDPRPLSVGQTVLAIGLFLGMIVTTLVTGGLFLGFDVLSQLDRLPEVLPLSVGIWILIAAHELGHWWVARRYQISLSLPFFIPTWQIGTFGSIVQFQSILPNRSALFDIAAAGPLTGVALSLLFLITGLNLSHSGSLFQIPSEFFQGSILIAVVSKLVLGNQLTQAIVAVHPLMLLGWLGLVINSLNLLPAGQLDGGRMMQAIYGRRVAGIATVISLIFLGVATLVNPLALYWAIVILVAQRNLERPSSNELLEPSDSRALLALLGFLITILTLIPLPSRLAIQWGIGVTNFF